MSEEANKTPQQQEENIFIANPEPPKTARTSTITKEVIAAIIAVIIILTTAFLWSFMAANSAAGRYETSVEKQLMQIEGYLQPLKPDIVLNNRNIDVSVENITSLKQPVLENVFFGSFLSTKYQYAEKTRNQVDSYYSQLNTFAEELTLFNTAEPEILNIVSTTKKAQSEAKINDASSLRSLSGTLEAAAQKITNIKVPAQLKDIQQKVGEQYREQAKLYADWAVAIEGNQLEKVARIQATLEKSNQTITELTSDENYIKQFQSMYDNVMKRQKALTKRLA